VLRLLIAVLYAKGKAEAADAYSIDGDLAVIALILCVLEGWGHELEAGRDGSRKRIPLPRVQQWDKVSLKKF
jgi:hypothetical protein